MPWAAACQSFGAATEYLKLSGFSQPEWVVRLTGVQSAIQLSHSALVGLAKIPPCI